MYPKKDKKAEAARRAMQEAIDNHTADLAPVIDGRKVILEASDVIRQYNQYDEVVTAVNRASFRVFMGEFVAIVGASGSGKSTLLHLCAGLDRPQAGSIVVRGHKLESMNEDELGKFRGSFLGMIFQSHHLIPHLTALENILVPTLMCGRDEISYDQHLKLLVASLDLADRLHHLPSELSGGQQQRVAIARALINRPQILFADEPTGNLDRANAEDVLQLLLNTRAEMGCALVMVTHDLSIAARADRVFKMEGGRLRLWNNRLDGILPGYEGGEESYE
jgi:ABC-type lipoprotein export system ATPase subunit